MASPSSGFVIQSVELLGPNIKGSLDLEPGLNVIYGPSDTGKTFIVQCIDYVFGSTKTPKEIPESRGFREVSLILRTRAGDEVKLTRNLVSGSSIVSSISGSERVLSASHKSGDSETISHLLMELSNLAGKVVRTNDRGSSREMSFRDVARFVIVDEEAIIADSSPVESGQLIFQTVEKSVLRVLLDGEDDLGTVETPALKDLKQQRQGQRQLLVDLLDEVNGEIAGTGVQSADRAAEAIELLDRSIATIDDELRSARSAASALEGDRRGAWMLLRTVQSRQASATELHSRFLLLHQQYVSDLGRLEATAEAGELLAALVEERCPVCGSEPANHDVSHRSAEAAPEDVASASRAEAAKIRMLIADLLETINLSTLRISDLSAEENSALDLLAQIDADVAERLQPQISETVARLQEQSEARRHLGSAVRLFERRTDLQRRLVKAEATPKRGAKLSAPVVRQASVDALATTVEEILRSWNFPGADRVHWSASDLDLVIGGKPRGSFGKGVRALTHAAFSLALLTYTDRFDLGHPGLVILDSPLVVYREPEKDDGDAYDVKDSFYRSLASGFSERQVIVLENVDPPSGLLNTNLIAFTRSGHGRSGFLPPESP